MFTYVRVQSKLSQTRHATTGDCVESAWHFMPLSVMRSDSHSDKQFTGRVQHVDVRVTAGQALRLASCTQQQHSTAVNIGIPLLQLSSDAIQEHSVSSAKGPATHTEKNEHFRKTFCVTVNNRCR